MRRASPGVHVADLRSFRFRFDVFFVRMWLLKAWPRFTLPEPVTLKRFATLLLVFIFGIDLPLYPGVQPAPFFGPTTIVIVRPSIDGTCSTLPMSSSSLATLTITSRPNSGCAS